MGDDYAELSRIIRERGLLERQYGYYVFKTALTISLLALSVFFLLTVDNFGLQLLNAAFLAFVFVQLAQLMHDADHQEIFKSKSKNIIAGLFFGNLLVSLSSGVWTERHNQHHNAPNHVDIDPDIDLAYIAYSEEQALDKKGIARFIVKYQAYLWLPLQLLPAFIFRIGFFKLLISQAAKGKPLALVETALLVVSTAAYLGIIFYSLHASWQAIIFILANYSITGMYMGSIFATNHKGMPIMKEKADFLRVQVLTSRDVRPSLITDFWTGGLNYQIEHHLFPTMPRNNLSKAQKIIKEFCAQKGIPYYESGFIESYKEILQHLHGVSAVLRRKAA